MSSSSMTTAIVKDTFHYNAALHIIQSVADTWGERGEGGVMAPQNLPKCPPLHTVIDILPYLQMLASMSKK